MTGCLSPGRPSALPQVRWGPLPGATNTGAIEAAPLVFTT